MLQGTRVHSREEYIFLHIRLSCLFICAFTIFVCEVSIVGAEQSIAGTHARLWYHHWLYSRLLPSLDFASCFNLNDVECDPTVTNAAVFTWEPLKDASIFFKVQNV